MVLLNFSALNPLSFKGKGHIRLSQFRPQALMAYLLHDSTLQVTDARANFSIDLTLDGTGNLKAAIDGGIPLLALRRGPEELLIKGGRIRCTAHIGNGKVEISLKEIGLDFPRLQATGGFIFDESRQDIQLTINGSRIDAASVRQAAIGILGESETIQKIFKVIRGGFVPWMTVRIQGREISDLGKLNNIVIKGRMTQGKIFIPGAELDLVDVVGDAFQFETDGADDFRAGIDLDAGKGLHGLGVAEAVADRGVSGNVFGDKGQSSGIGRQKQFFGPAVLVSQLDFQVQDPLTDAVETKMARFDHAGMHRADRHLMDPIAFHRIIIVVAGNILAVVVAEEIIYPAAVGMVAHHFQPWMAFGADTVLLGNFALEHVERCAACRQCRIGFRCVAGGHQQPAGAQHSQQADIVMRLECEKLNDLAAF